jgi:isocitrate lyase
MTDERKLKVCSLCQGKGTVPEPSSETVAKVLDMALAADVLYSKTDAEIADLLEKHVWARMSILSVKSDLVSQAIDRLRRAVNDPYPRPSDEETSDDPL